MKKVYLNVNRINYDNSLDFSKYEDTTFYENTKKEDIINNVSDNEIVIVKEMVLDKDTINKLPSTVKMICEAGTGYNNIDIEASKERGILVSNIPSYSTNTVATFTMMFILNLSTSFKQNEKMLFNNDYSNFNEHLKNSYIELENKTLGIIGYGSIGKEVAKRAKTFGMNVICNTKTKREDEDGVHFVELDELLESSDFITLHCLLNGETRHILNRDNMYKIKKGAFIVNTARGALIEEEVLVELLNNKHLAGAALDVLEKEPCSIDNPLLKMDNVIITPHMAWNSKEARQRLVDMVLNNIKNYENNNPVNIVNS